jgi:hypothetical protein
MDAIVDAASRIGVESFGIIVCFAVMASYYWVIQEFGNKQLKEDANPLVVKLRIGGIAIIAAMFIAGGSLAVDESDDLVCEPNCPTSARVVESFFVWFVVALVLGLYATR